MVIFVEKEGLTGDKEIEYELRWYVGKVVGVLTRGKFE